MKKTGRGFRIYSEFRDSCGTEIRVQESSDATKRAVWIFAETRPEFATPSPHLTVAQAKRMITALQKFIEKR